MASQTMIKQFARDFETEPDKINKTIKAGSSYVLKHGQYALKIMIVYADQTTRQMPDRFHTSIESAFKKTSAQLKISPVTSINHELKMLQTAEASGITPKVFEVSTLFLNDYVDCPYIYAMLKKLNVLTPSEKMSFGYTPFAPVYCVGILMENMDVNYENDESTANYGNAVAAALHLTVTTGIFHCDLKIDNWLIPQKRTNLDENPPIVLIDLGACYQLDEVHRLQLEKDLQTSASFMKLFSVLCNDCVKNGVGMRNTLCNIEGSTDVDGVVHPYYEQLNWHEIFDMFILLKKYVKGNTTGHIIFEAPNEDLINERNIPDPVVPAASAPAAAAPAAAAPAAPPAPPGWGSWIRTKVGLGGKKTKRRKSKRRHSRKHRT